MINNKFFSSESLADCSYGAMITFVGIWCCADDEGRMKFAPRSLKKDIFGMKDLTMQDFFGFLAELEAVGCIRFYVKDGNAYVDVPNFTEYQTISHAKKSGLPNYSCSVPVAIQECSMSVPPKELIKELINQGGSGNADAPLRLDDWKMNYEVAANE